MRCYVMAENGMNIPLDQYGYSSIAQQSTAGQRTFLIFWFNLGATLAQRNAFLRKLFKQYRRPRVVITDKLGSYSAALKSLAPAISFGSRTRL